MIEPAWFVFPARRVSSEAGSGLDVEMTRFFRVI